MANIKKTSDCPLSKNLKIKIYKNYNFTSCSVWVQNVASHAKGRTQTGSVWEQGA
jgi:hypothetical protein